MLQPQDAKTCLRYLFVPGILQRQQAKTCQSCFGTYFVFVAGMAIMLEESEQGDAIMQDAKTDGINALKQKIDRKVGDRERLQDGESFYESANGFVDKRVCACEVGTNAAGLGHDDGSTVVAGVSIKRDTAPQGECGDAAMLDWCTIGRTMHQGAVDKGSEQGERKDVVMQDGVTTDVAVRGVTTDAVMQVSR